MSQRTAGAQKRLYGLQNRYVFTGQLLMTTGLHLGGGKATLSASDSPVVLTPDGLPYIPGSSLKGSLRSTTEKVVAGLPELGLTTCGLCEGVQGETCATAHAEAIFERRRQARNAEEARQIMEEERGKLCHTCQLFGSPFAAGRIAVSDLGLLEESWSTAIQIRDGVAIDRDTETARPSLKYNFEVVPASTRFQMRLVLENATETDLRLLSIGLSEFLSGYSSIGGFRTRGLGGCLLDELKIYKLDLADPDPAIRQANLRQYLKRNRSEAESGLAEVNVEAFFQTYLENLYPDETPQVLADSPAEEEK
jgi:CRISPR-associated RAMP protein (TIGR02581 family)